MSAPVYERIRQNPKFQELVRARRQFSWSLTAFVFVFYFGFVFTVAFNPAALAAPLAEGGMMTVGIVTASALIVVFWLATGYYVQRANSEFDTLNKEVVEAATKETR